jgi:glucose/arabinose dehydrogenase
MMNPIAYLVLFFGLTLNAQAESKQAILKQLKLPAGFSISLFADHLPNARSMAIAENGVVFVGTGQKGNVYAVQDTNGDGLADKTFVIARQLYMPNGLAYKNGALYVAEVNRIIKFENVLEHLEAPQKPKIVYDKFPSDQHHGWKYLRFGPDDKLYTAVGAPCNICEPDKDIYTSLVRLNPDGSDFEIIARGIRNSVGMAWEPETKSLFFTDNGRDQLGDDVPPEELNQWSVKGQHFGYPYCHGGTISDPEFGNNKSCKNFVAPAWTFKAHMAPLGLHFYRGKQFPVGFKNQLFVAQHGSWNRTEPHGYRVVLVKFEQGKPVADDAFISGWLTGTGKVLGRPVDVLETQDGSLLISDDHLGVIYKVTYTP